jgi:hypothetical protein
MYTKYLASTECVCITLFSVKGSNGGGRQRFQDGCAVDFPEQHEMEKASQNLYLYINISYIYIYIRMYMYICICMHVCVYVYIHVILFFIHTTENEHPLVLVQVE